ncbi:MAG: Fic family protein [Bacteroidota bacterium]
MYIYQYQGWPAFQWNTDEIAPSLGKVRHSQGNILGRMQALGFDLQEEAILQTLTLDVLKSTQIEGENLDPEQVRSSVARRLGIDVAGMVASNRNVEGVVEMMLEATQNYGQDLTKDRLFDWHAALFPTGRSGLQKMAVGAWRDQTQEPMQVVSGPMGREKVHFQAPEAERIEGEMEKFLQWFNSDSTIDPVQKAAIAHLWFVTIHPFDDGNGRIARAITDMQLARADNTEKRFYSMSAQIIQERNAYYSILESTQKSDLDITAWLQWFLSCLQKALHATDDILSAILAKADFWRKHATTPLNERQKKMINKLFDDFFGELTSSKWAKMMKCSQDTAGRDIQDLVDKAILVKDLAGGRSTHYSLNKT